MLLRLIRKYSANDELIKAVFEHFRNLGIAVVIGTASGWLIKDAWSKGYPGGLIGFLYGAVLGVVALLLLCLAIGNASHRLEEVGFGNKGCEIAAWVLYGGCVLGGMISYTVMH